MLTVRPAQLADIEAISNLVSASLDTTSKGVMSTEEIDYLHDLSFSQGQLKNDFDEGQRFFIADIDGINCGFASLIKEGPDLYYLTKIFVDRRYQRQGVGRALINYVAELIKKEHPEPCALELAVNPHNAAVGFYEHMGMSKVREQLSDLGSGFMLAQDVMSLKL